MKGVFVKKSSSPVVILGAGLAGLSCALRLHKNGTPYLLLEKSNEVGGRIRTSKTNEGFLLDHGFQVLLTSYPELSYCLNLKKLELQYFNSGALIYTPQKTRLLANPFLHPSQLLSETLSNFVSLKDKALVVKLVLGLHTHAFKKQKPVAALSFLENFGFSEDFIESFWRPFCSGVFLDKNLDVDSEYFIFLLKNFSTGRVAVPKYGMQQIPLQISEQLSNASVRMGVDVKEIFNDAVLLADGTRINASAVVCAYDPDAPDAVKNEYRSVINYYFSAKNNPKWEKWLMLIPPHYGLHLNNICVMSHVSTSYSNKENILLSASIVGTEDPGEILVAKEINQIAGTDLNLKFIKKYNIKKALPKKYTREETSERNGIFYCGDYLSSPSINGALKSGRLTAEKILALSDKK